MISHSTTVAEDFRNNLDVVLPPDLVTEGIELYFAHYCNQPCPILAHSISVQPSLNDRPPAIVLYPMLALSLRSSQHTSCRYPQVRQEYTKELTRHSWNLLVKAYCEFNIDDAYFEGLCLLAQVDAGGKLP